MLRHCLRLPEPQASCKNFHVHDGVCVHLDGRDQVFAVTHAELDDCIIPLCEKLRSLASDRQGRTTVAIVGPAGAGKSVLAHLLASTCNQLWQEDGGWATVLSMDAYHLPNKVLEQGSATHTDGNTYSLKQLKGLPRTINVSSLAAGLRRLKSGDGADVSLPAYDRTLHEPVAGRVTVTREHRLVLVEGLHLLHREGDWAQLDGLFEESVFLDIPLSACFDRSVGRKVANGRDRADCEAHFLRVDKPVYDSLQEEKERAGLILEMATGSGNDHGFLSVKSARRKLPPPPPGGGAFALTQASADGRTPVELLVIGLNGAIQKRIEFGPPRGFRLGEVNRAASVGVGIGGKGQDVCVAASMLPGGQARTTLVHFSGGQPGRQLDGLLEARGVKIIRGDTKAELRTCTTLIDRVSGDATEVVEPWGGQITGEESAALLDAVRHALASSTLNGVAFMGSLPAGVPQEFYAEILACIAASPAHQRGELVVLVDSVHGLKGLLGSGIVQVLKVNAKELVGVGLGSEAAQLFGKDHVDQDAKIEEASLALFSLYPGLQWVATTNGPAEGRLFQRPQQGGREAGGAGGERGLFSHWTYRLPVLEVVNPIGAGDTVSAISLAELARGVDAVEALRSGFAAACASCLTDDNSCFDASCAEGLRAGITIWHAIRWTPGANSLK